MQIDTYYSQKITNNYNTSQRLSIEDSEQNDECIRLTSSMMCRVQCKFFQVSNITFISIKNASIFNL